MPLPFPPVQWDPRTFELRVKAFLEALGRPLESFEAQHRELVDGAEGEYEIDIAARFEALGATFLVLVECKCWKSSVKREVVQVLHDKLRSAGAQKGMLFSTAGFQRGAIEYAQAHGIALIQVADGRAFYFTRDAFGTQPTELPPGVPEFGGWLTRLNKEGNETFSAVTPEDPRSLKAALGVD